MGGAHPQGSGWGCRVQETKRREHSSPPTSHWFLGAGFPCVKATANADSRGQGRPLPGSPGWLIPFPWFPGTSKVNLVRIPSAASSPRDTALAAVICSALATVLLALLILCTIYCKRQLMEKKHSCKSGARSVSQRWGRASVIAGTFG